jgi:hypothetical protein
MYTFEVCWRKYIKQGSAEAVASQRYATASAEPCHGLLQRKDEM